MYFHYQKVGVSGRGSAENSREAEQLPDPLPPPREDIQGFAHALVQRPQACQYVLYGTDKMIEFREFELLEESPGCRISFSHWYTLGPRCISIRKFKRHFFLVHTTVLKGILIPILFLASSLRSGTTDSSMLNRRSKPLSPHARIRTVCCAACHSLRDPRK